jgi:hypothetical protein
MRLKLQKRSELKFISRIIPHKQVFKAPQLAAESVPKACFGVHTRDYGLKSGIFVEVDDLFVTGRSRLFSIFTI